MDLEEVVRERVLNNIFLAIRLLKEHQDIDYIVEKTNLSINRIQTLREMLGIDDTD